VPVEAGNFSLHHRVQTGSGPTQSSIQWVPGLFPWGKSAGGVKLTTHLCLMPRLRMRGAISTRPNTPSWCGAQFKKAQGLNYLTD